MRRAIELAKQAKGCVLPNPKVGAVIVYRDKIVGEGFHHGPGKPHAEVEAIKDARRRGFKNFKASTLFVTLEPCCHLKKRTPPCAPLLISLGFKKVVIAHEDPNIKVSGKGILELKRAGISVDVGMLAEEASMLNQAFLKNHLKHLPYITLKVAMTFDGKLADDFHHSKWITGEEARHQVHRLRFEVDAIGIGSKTVDIDQPRLNSRLPNSKSVAHKIVIFGKPKHSSAVKKIIRTHGKENLILLPKSNSKNLNASLRNLYDKGSNGTPVCHLLIEGGARLASSFLKKNFL
jgi:diaminohydroxyphosphoribosylaminopyrimidine deaminase/5-amino-6-(5-phosphoribosylamino)uracil reductase